MFGSDDEEEEAENERLKAARVAEYEAKKTAGKPKPTAKSIVVIDVKPWDDETDMEEIKSFVLALEVDGLVWGTSKFMPIGYGIRKFQVTCVIVDDLVSTDAVQELIEAHDEFVQSTDIASFNKL